MSFQVIDFESSREKEKKRQFEREARNVILEKAKNDYEVRKAREEVARQRGEHTWMLSSVEAKLDSSKKKKKKKEKKKKKKKEKKSKKSKRDHSSSSSSDSEDNGETWIEKSEPSVGVPSDAAAASKTAEKQDLSSAQAKRDGWMEMTSLFGTFTRDEMRERDGTSRKKAKEEEEARKREANKPGSHARELNPYFRDGGTGLPEEQPQQKVSVGLDAAWLRRALQRAKEQAEKENKSLEEIAAQRWGSLAKFHELLAEAEGQRKGRSENQWQSRGGNRERSPGRERRLQNQGRRRSRSRERQNERRRSSSRDRQDHKGGRRSTSRERHTHMRRSRSRSSDRNRRSKSRERQRRSRSRERQRSRSKERHARRREQGRHRRHSSSSSSSSSSSRTGSSHSRSRSRSRSRLVSGKGSGEYRERSEGGIRSVKGLLKPPRDSTEHSEPRTSFTSRFQKPGEGTSFSSSQSARSISNRGWQKKQPQDTRENQMRTFSKKTVSSSSSSSSSSSESEEEPPSKVEAVVEKETMSTSAAEGPAPKPKLLTDKEMNDLAAKIMKAELIGNETQAAKFKKKLEAARTARANAPPGGEEEEDTKEEVVVLTRMDARGVCRPVSGAQEGGNGKKRKKMQTHDKGGQRTKYFPDDDQYDLKRMFEREKGTSAADQNSLFERSAMQNVEKLNEEYDLDDMFMSKAVQKETSAKQAERDRQKAIKEHKRSEQSLEACQWCFDNKEMPKHLIVALGTKAYVCLPPHQSLTPGHCFIVPIHHVPCAVQADEDLWSEIQNFRRSLVRMFNSREEDCIFFETVKRLKNYPHMVINCVPLPREIGDMAPIYFKKAIMECEAEWAQNKKLVDLKNRDVRSAVPKGLPYFFVDFAMDPGYAHVIEDEQDFPYTFAQEIVGGMMDLENNLWRKPRKENFDAQRKKVMEFSSWYKEFDITQDG